MPDETFKSKQAYDDWNAYRHIHGIPAPNLDRVTINGHTHTVHHSSLSRPKRKAERRLKRFEARRRHSGLPSAASR